ncbi:MAG: hypothetical protein ACK56Z_05430 [Pseudanabaena sp.]
MRYITKDSIIRIFVFQSFCNENSKKQKAKEVWYLKQLNVQLQRWQSMAVVSEIQAE